MTIAAFFTVLTVWALALLPVATTIGRIPHADRYRDSEETEREPLSERPSKILVISNHGENM